MALRRHQLRRLARGLTCELGDATSAALLEWLGGRVWAPETVRSHLSAFRSFFKWANSQGLLVKDPTEGLPSPRRVAHLPRPASEEAVAEAMRVADGRVRTMVALGVFQGLRRGEIARLHMRDIVLGPSGPLLIVRGKGGRERVVPLRRDVAALIRVQGQRDWLFPGQDEGHLSPAWVGRLVRRALPDGWATHSLRHAFATKVYGSTHDLLTVQALLGHASPNTTQGYVLGSADALRAAVESA
ncbi:MAG: tyrosine-type recombinase/integrase [Propionibacteriaceae bacterium]|nr:tyrosine-type recombinase/integrase [Propionibacteriaceae bacterium]